MDAPIMEYLPIRRCLRSLRLKHLALPLTSCTWLRFVDDIFVIHKAEHSTSLLQHLNSKDPHIQFKIEEPNQQGSLPFLDTLVSPGPHNTLITTVYRKPTHRDQYLHWDSSHYIGARHSVYNTLAHRAKVVSHDQQTLEQEVNHIRSAIQACHFPIWTLDMLQQRFEQRHQLTTTTEPRDNQPSTTNTNNIKINISMVVPYIQGLGEKFKMTCKNIGIQVHFQGSNTVQTLLIAPKDKDPKLHKSGIIYNYKCPQLNCTEQYIGESGRTLGDRLKEHLRAPFNHTPTQQHLRAPNQSRLFHSYPQGSKDVSRNIKEAMFIRVNDPSLNRNIGKYQLPHIWDQVLQDTPAQQIPQHYKVTL